MAAPTSFHSLAAPQALAHAEAARRRRTWGAVAAALVAGLVAGLALGRP